MDVEYGERVARLDAWRWAWLTLLPTLTGVHNCRSALAAPAQIGQSVRVRFELTPPDGVGPIRIGMTREDAKKALGEWGEPEPFGRGNSPPGWIVRRPATVFVYCDDSGLVDAVEFGSPGHGGRSLDQVSYEGVDVFGQRALDVVAQLRALGVAVTEAESGYSFTAEDLLLAFWRDGDPYDSDDMPEFFAAALVARPGYYD